MRLLAFDPGFNFGFAAFGGVKISSGSRAVRGGARQMGIAGRHCDRIVRELIAEHRPEVIAFATPFVGSRGGHPVQPDSIRPLMGFLTVIEMAADELGIRCTEWDEPAARRAFLTKVPRKSKDIKDAVMRACRARNWPCTNDHAGDALCLGAWALEHLVPTMAHETTPLFTKRRRKAA